MPTHIAVLLVATPVIALAALACALAAKPGAKSLGKNFQGIGISLTVLSAVFFVGGLCLMDTVTAEPPPGEGLTMYLVLHVYLPFAGAWACFSGGLSLWLEARRGGPT